MNLDDPALNRRHHDAASVDALCAKYRNWGRWGEDDELGSGNLVTPERIVKAMHTVRTGKTFSLALPFDRMGPQGANVPRINPQHVMLRMPHEPLGMGDGRQTASDDAVYMPLQCATQWDAFCHMFQDGVTYNNRPASSINVREGATYNSITNFKDRALGRGVLLDMVRHLGVDWLPNGYAIQSGDLEACAQAQGVEVGEGDFLLVRTGQLLQTRTEGSWGTYAGGPAPGLGVSTADFICGRGVVAVATDTWGIEANPYETAEMLAPLHIVLLVNAGVYIGEMWDMEELAADCAEDGVYEFFLTAQPLTVSGAVGSPLNPVVVK